MTELSKAELEWYGGQALGDDPAAEIARLRKIEQAARIFCDASEARWDEEEQTWFHDYPDHETYLALRQVLGYPDAEVNPCSE